MLDFMAQHGKHTGRQIKLSLLPIWRLNRWRRKYGFVEK
jgi:hypothetical protein